MLRKMVCDEILLHVRQRLIFVSPNTKEASSFEEPGRRTGGGEPAHWPLFGWCGQMGTLGSVVGKGELGLGSGLGLPMYIGLLLTEGKLGTAI